ncbi:glycosyltransferase [Reichenbachiella sp. MALMAid0571]|uniref:glycosyltransferase n=1 Tax=Reichenbachiella sp. MALMAid0571 TaxID=3143939 RepID=UPI0032DFDB83
MNNSDVIFSVVIPTYNRADRLVLAVKSVLAQEFKKWELIIVDDGSTDHTKDQIAEFTDHRIRYFYKKNEERAIARNFGIERAKGQYITFLDSDDELYSHCFSEALDLKNQSNNPEWFHLAYEMKNEKGKVINRVNRRKGDLNKTLITGNHLSCIGVFVRKDIMSIHQFNEHPIIIGSEDYILWMRLAARFHLYYTNRICAFMNQHDERSVLSFDADKLEQRVLRSIEIILSDDTFCEKFGSKKDKLIAHRFIYLSLHLAMEKKTFQSFPYLLKSICREPLMIFSRKFLAVVKTIL